MRNAFIDELILQARRNPNIALIVGDLGYSVVEPFADEFPDRFINAGVAEQNMMGLAAGMASEGYHVFTYSIANFPTFRCAEQIRNDVDYHNLPVTVVSVGGGLAYGALGYSHHAVQDYALMRTMPNMLIGAPGDPLEVRAIMQYLIANPGPSYLRLGKAGEPNLHGDIPNIYPGSMLNLRTNKETKKLLLTTGATLELGLSAKEQSEFSVKSIPLWGMGYKENIAKEIEGFEEILVIEDHLVDGGFGSWILEALSVYSTLKVNQPKVSLVALDPKVTSAVGRQETLNALGGLSNLNKNYG